jgi:hypothetical protein
MDYCAIHPIDAGALIGKEEFGISSDFLTLDASQAKKLLAALRRPSWQPSHPMEGLSTTSRVT